jgi:hypothetical protein
MISWIGTISSIFGAFLVANQFAVPGYCLFILGSVSWAFVGLKRRDMALFWLNAIFLCANIMGIYNNL